LIVEAERTRRAVETMALDVLQEIEDGRRPGVAGTSDGVTDTNPDPRRQAVGEAARRDQGDLRLGRRWARSPVVDRRFLVERGDDDLTICCRQGADQGRPHVPSTRLDDQ